MVDLGVRHAKTGELLMRSELPLKPCERSIAEIVREKALRLKRLDNGQFQWPRNEIEARLLTPQQTRWLLEGLKIDQPKAIKDGKTGMIY